MRCAGSCPTLALTSSHSGGGCRQPAGFAEGEASAAAEGDGEDGAGFGDLDGGALDRVAAGVGGALDAVGRGDEDFVLTGAGLAVVDRLGAVDAVGDRFPRAFAVFELATPVTTPVTAPSTAPTRITVARIGPERDGGAGGRPSSDTCLPYPVPSQPSLPGRR